MVSRPRKPKKNGPIIEVAKEWTEVRTPLRTTKVPKIESTKADRARMTFQVLSSPRRSWTTAECK